MRKSTSSSELRLMLSALSLGRLLSATAVPITSLIRLLLRLIDSMPRSMERSFGSDLMRFSAKLS